MTNIFGGGAKKQLSSCLRHHHHQLLLFDAAKLTSLNAPSFFVCECNVCMACTVLSKEGVRGQLPFPVFKLFPQNHIKNAIILEISGHRCRFCLKMSLSESTVGLCVAGIIRAQIVFISAPFSGSWDEEERWRWIPFLRNSAGCCSILNSISRFLNSSSISGFVTFCTLQRLKKRFVLKLLQKNFHLVRKERRGGEKDFDPSKKSQINLLKETMVKLWKKNLLKFRKTKPGKSLIYCTG